MHNGEMTLIIEPLKASWMVKAEKSIKVENVVVRNGDAGAHRIVILLAIGNDNIEPVGGAALEDDNEPASRRRRGIRQHRANKKAGMAAVPATANAPLRRRISG